MKPHTLTRGGGRKAFSASERDQIVSTLKALMFLHGIRSPRSIEKFAVIARRELVAEETVKMGAVVARMGVGR